MKFFASRIWLIIGICFGLFILPDMADAQHTVREKSIPLMNDSFRIDSLSTVPGSLEIRIDSLVLEPGTHYTFYPVSSTLVINKSVSDTLLLKSTMLTLHYQVFPLALDKEYFLHSRPNNDSLIFYDPFPVTEIQQSPQSSIKRQGSLSRMISTGNAQNTSLHSDLDLQLSGKLNETYTLKAVLSDRNIPVQPEGTTTTLREFDRMFIEVEGGGLHLLAGDLRMKMGASPFLKYDRKVQGLTGAYEFKPGKMSMQVKAGMAMSRGKYTRQNLEAIEGNQGPYRLSGNNGEIYIVILSGTEKVFLDGRALTRGRDQDYIIDYNLAQITFMPTIRITEQSRIIVEFEYSERSFARIIGSGEVNASGERLNISFQVLSESDLRNQNFQQVLSPTEQQLLSGIGDSLELAITPRIDTVEFTGDEVLYKQVDTLVNAISYPGVFVYSTHPDSARYRLGFSYVGAGKGNYIRIQSAANGKVYQWVAPVNGMPSGDYEPVTRLVTPNSQQMMSLGSTYKLSQGTEIFANLSLSNTDLNTFSSFDTGDDIGLATRVGLKNQFTTKDSTWQIGSGISFRRVGENFGAFDRYRTPEFERNWNISNKTKLSSDGEWLLHATAFKDQLNNYTYEFARLSQADFKGNRHALEIKSSGERLSLQFRGSYLQSEADAFNSRFYRHDGTIGLRQASWKFSIRNQVESNQRLLSDSLQTGSASFILTESRISREKELSSTSVAWLHRTDQLPTTQQLTAYSSSDDIELKAIGRRKGLGSYSMLLAYRNIEYADSAPGSADQYLLARINGKLSFGKGVFSLNAGYESNSGSELRKEYTYLKVADGQGVYAWADYNNDSIQQLDEFEIAVFSDQANYLRVFIPTNEYIRVFRNSMHADLSLRAPIAWRKEKGLKKFGSRFSADAMARFNTRHSDLEDLDRYTPFPGMVPEDQLTGFQRQWRGNLYFNRGNPAFSLSLGAREQAQRSLLANGFESSSRESYELRTRTRITKAVKLNLEAEYRTRGSNSEFFENRSYQVKGYTLEPKIDFQPGRIYRVSVYYRYSEQENVQGSENSYIHDAGVSLRYSFPGKGLASAKLSRSAVRFDGDSNSPVGWEMLNSLVPGTNYIWSAGIQRNLKNNLQMNLLYEGRKMPGTKVIHTGSLQVRAYF